MIAIKIQNTKYNKQVFQLFIDYCISIIVLKFKKR